LSSELKHAGRQRQGDATGIDPKTVIVKDLLPGANGAATPALRRNPMMSGRCPKRALSY
jgi:hypothetical protein